MTNDFHDFDPSEAGHEEQTQRQGMGANLAEAWRSRPLFKLMVLIVAVAAIVGVSVSLFSGTSTTGKLSNLVRPPDIHEAPGGPISPYMQKQTEMADQQRVDQAMQNGGSAMKTPIGKSTDVGDMDSGSNKSDSLKELEAEIERQKQQIAQIQQQPQTQMQQQKPQEPFDDTLAQAMQKQMGQLMDSWVPRGIKEVSVIKPDTTAGAGSTLTNAAGTNGANGSNVAAASTPAPKILVPAGTVSYAQLLTEANSDVPGPILAQIVSGPLAGARAVGQFQVANGYADYLVLQFTLADLKGKDYTLNAIALDPDTTLGGMATEVDQRYFTRVVLPAAAGFLQAFGSSLGQGSSSVTTNGTTTVVTQSGVGIRQGLYAGLGQGATTASQFFQNQANQTMPLVRVAAGTPMGMFFVSSVVDQAPQPPGAYGTGYPNGYPPGYAGGYNNGYPPGYPGANPQAGYGIGGGYPGSTVAGYGGQSQLGTGAGVPYPNYSNSSYRPSSFGIPVNSGVGAPYGVTTYGH